MQLEQMFGTFIRIAKSGGIFMNSTLYNKMNNSYIYGHLSKKENKRKNRRVKKNTSFYGTVIFLVILISLIFLIFSPKRTVAYSDKEAQHEKYYTCIYVDGGDTLWDIASKYCTAEYSDYYEYINEVMSINNLHTSFIKSGTRLCIPYYAESPCV